jgi:hypothetical protein
MQQFKLLDCKNFKPNKLYLINMKKTLGIVLLGAVLAASAAPPTAARPIAANGSFTCGPHALTFAVRSLAPVRKGTGVRCVKISDGIGSQGIPRIAWYGEGNWEGGTYRHVGQAVTRRPSDVSGVGYASDINGNGEAANNNFPGTLKVSLAGGTWNNPTRINVTGAWNETWIRVSKIGYTPLERPKTCGSYFDQYTVSDLAGSRAGEGLRCVLKVGPKNTTWFGNGNWGGTTYSHLGTKGHNGYGAGDICDAPFGPTCNTFGYGSLDFSVAGQVTGAWSEKWVP